MLFAWIDDKVLLVQQLIIDPCKQHQTNMRFITLSKSQQHTQFHSNWVKTLWDTSVLPVNHCSQSTVFGAFHRKHLEHAEKHEEHARTGKRLRMTSKNTTQNSAGTSLLKAEKNKGLVIAVLTSTVRMNDTPRSIKGLLFPCFSSLNKGWRTAKPGSKHVVDPMDICTLSALARSGSRARMDVY